MASDDNKRTASGAIGFLDLLTLLFIGLRLTGYIDWPWWVVLAPLWGQLALIVVIVFILVLYYLAKK